MNVSDFTLFRGFLKKTTDSDPHKALQAIREANLLLSKNHLTWDELLYGKVQVTTTIADGYAQEHNKAADRTKSDRDKHIEHMFSTIMENKYASIPDWQKKLVDSFYEQWENRHSLSPKQYDILVTAYERTTDVK